MTDNEFRALALLRAVVLYMDEHGGEPPSQKLLATQLPQGGWGGILNDWLTESGARAEMLPFGFTGGPHLHAAAVILSENGLFEPRGFTTHKVKGGMKGKHNRYLPTERGVALGRLLATIDWEQWESRWIKGE